MNPPRPAHGRFITRVVTHVRTHQGHFGGSFRALGRGFYAVRAYYSGEKSAKQDLLVS
jgi:hypothetical protein